jgi:hypothetical protein
LASSLLVVALCAAVGCGGEATRTISTPELTSPQPPAAQEQQRQLPADPAIDLLHELMADLQVATAAPNPPAIARALTRTFPGTQVGAADIQAAVDATCSKGTGDPLRAFIRDGLPQAGVGAAGVLDEVVALIDQSCPLNPGQYLQLQSVVLVELARNGMRGATSSALRERELNDQACAVFRTSGAFGGRIADGLTIVARRHQLGARNALDIGVKAVIQACPFFIADFRGALDELRRA